MNIAEAFAAYLEEELLLGTVGTDIFISRAPETPSTMWWVRLEANTLSDTNITGEVIRPVTLSVYHRDINAKDVYDRLESLQDDLQAPECILLTGYTVIDVEVAGPFTDQDIDREERTVGVLQVTLTIYKEY